MMRKLIWVIGLGLMAAAEASASRLTFTNDREFTQGQLESARAAQVRLDELFGLLPPFSADTSAHPVVFALSQGDMALRLFGHPPSVKFYLVVTENAQQTLFLFWDIIQREELPLLEVFELIAAFVHERQPRNQSNLPIELSSKSFQLHGILLGLRALNRSSLFAQLTPGERWDVGARIENHLKHAHNLILAERQAGVDCASLLRAIYN